MTNFNLRDSYYLRSLGVYEFYEHYEAMIEESKRKVKDNPKNGSKNSLRG